jgi:malate/lactate dehydrogenase
MKIMIIGIGRLGSTVAFLTLLRLKPEKLILSDIKDLTGDILDLQHACKGLGIKTKIITEREPCDFIVITAGFARNQKIKTHEELLKLNEPVIKEIINNINGCLKKDTKIIVMTNPVEEMTELVQELLPSYYVNNPEKILMKMRNNKELGWEIVSTKGYSNFGPAVSAVLLMERIKSI